MTVKIIYHLLCLLYLIGHYSATDLNYRLYYTDRISMSNSQYDCILCNENDLIDKYENEQDVLRPYQIIPFCIRLSDLEPNGLINNQNEIIHGIPITFEKLRNLNYTSEDLYLSSISIDTVEHTWII